jgi:mono/diheme cytochrome c family protein
VARAADDLVAQGKQVVETKKCSICHKPEGKAKPIDALAGDKTDDFLKGSLIDPKKTIGADTKMPSYKDKLTDTEVNAVVAYLKSLKK